MMKIEISRRNFLLTASAAVAFNTSFVKRVKAIEDEFLLKCEQINFVYLLSSNNLILAKMDDVVRFNNEDVLTLQMPDFKIIENGLADRIAVYRDDELLFTVPLVNPANVTVRSTVIMDTIHIGAPNWNR